MKKVTNKKTLAGAGRQRARETDRRQPEAQFAVCIDNEGYNASLELGKL